MITVHEGSSLYYSLLWTAPEARARFIARLELLQALNSTLDEVQEATVAETKIHWWHEELQRMIDGEARHPATKACQPSFQPSLAAGINDPVLAACLSILSSVSTSRFTPAATDTEAATHMTQNYAAQLALLCHALSEQADDLNVESHSSITALALSKYEQLTRLPYLLHRGHPVFSDETYKRHSVRPTDLATHVRVEQATPDDDSPTTGSLGKIPIKVDSPGRRELLAAAINDAASALRQACDDEQTIQRYRQSPLQPVWRLLVLREKQVAMWQKQQPDILRERSSLTPLVKLFTAWRNKR